MTHHTITVTKSRPRRGATISSLLPSRSDWAMAAMTTSRAAAAADELGIIQFTESSPPFASILAGQEAAETIVQNQIHSPHCIMAQQYPPYDLVNQALQSLSLGGKLPKFEENEVDDASILKALTDKATLSAMLNECIPAGRVPHFIEAFEAAQERREEVRGAKAAAARAACGSWNSTPAGRGTRAPRGGGAR